MTEKIKDCPLCEGKSKINIDDFFYIDEGKECVLEEEALAFLLAAEQVFLNERKYLCIDNKTVKEPTTVAFVLCNDVFAWGFADSEDLPNDEIGNVLKAYVEDPVWGVAKWCCKRKKLRPQLPVEKLMKKRGSWDDELESFKRMGEK